MRPEGIEPRSPNGAIFGKIRKDFIEVKAIFWPDSNQ